MTYKTASDLTKMMLEYNVGVSTSQKYELKRLDNDYFEI